MKAGAVRLTIWRACKLPLRSLSSKDEIGTTILTYQQYLDYGSVYLYLRKKSQSSLIGTVSWCPVVKDALLNAFGISWPYAVRFKNFKQV